MTDARPDPCGASSEADDVEGHDVAVKKVAEELDVAINDPEWLRQALTHRSHAFEQGTLPHNERLEFLGDAVLGLIITDHIFHHEPEASEGRLAKLRAVVVSEPSLAAVARELDLGAHVHLGRGEHASGGGDKDSILADTLEAVIGAIYLDQGLEVAERLVRGWFHDAVVDLSARPEAVDAKTALQELLAAGGYQLPRYRIAEEGPDHAKRFAAEVYIEGEPCGRGEGRTKKEAEQGAAAEAVRRLRGSGEASAVSSSDASAVDSGDEAQHGGRR